MRTPSSLAAISGLLALLLLLAAVGCSPTHEPEPTPTPQAAERPRLIVLVSIDTLRADHLGMYGHTRFTSPVLDTFAADGVLFDDASATSPWTLPSHASLLTGRTPLTHNVVTYQGKLGDDVPTLAALLEGVGYRSAAVVSSLWLERDTYALTRDFDEYEYLEVPAERRHVSTMNADQVEDWLTELGDAPLFLFVHYYDVHSDYVSDPKYEKLFVTPYEGIADGTGAQLLQANFEDDYLKLCHEHFDPAKCRFGQGTEVITVDENTQKIVFDADDIRHLEERYDAGIRQMDSELGRLFGMIDEAAPDRDALVIVTSDHGEEFLDHGRVDHFLATYQESLRVPLIIRGPGIPRGERIAAPVSLIDIAPTILELAQAPIPADIEGRSLLGLLRDDAEVEAGFRERFIFGEAAGGETVKYLVEGIFPIFRSVRRDNFKLIHDSKTDVYALYDLALDPGERRDVSAEHPEIAEKLEAVMRARYTDLDLTPSEANRVELDEAERERLRALGYIQ